jgi:hypothetical protein
LGKLDRQKLDGVTKTILYDDIGADITLQKERVYLLSGFCTEGRQQRYLPALS